MTAKKRRTGKRAAPKALPSTWNLEQLDDELRVALGLAQRPGVGRDAAATPFVYQQQRPKAQTRAEKKRADPVVMEQVPWTDAQLATIQATMAAHVADPLWGEKADLRTIRLILTDANADAYLATTSTNPPTNAQSVAEIKDLIRAVRALARIARGQIQ